MSQFLAGVTMVESHSDVLERKLTYAASELGSGAAILGIVIVACVICAIANGAAGAITTPAGSVALVLVLVLLAVFLLTRIMRLRTVEFDLVARRLTISHSGFRRPDEVILDCPLNGCRALGRIEYETDGHASYGVYVELLSGQRHDVPIKPKTIQESGRTAAQLSEATGIPRRDTKF